MSVYKDPRSPFYSYDFQLRGRRFFGTTKATSRREAEAFERAERERQKKALTASTAAAQSLKLDDIVGRYWTEVGQHHAGASDTFRDLGRLVDYFGADRLLSDIGDDDVAKLVAWRRGHRVKRRPDAKDEDCPLVSNATVNRSTTLVLKKLFTRAKTAWRVRFEHEPNWKAHWLAEPQERVRELKGDEGERLDAATRDDYAPFLSFAHASGLRLEECLLRWSEVDWGERRISKLGKGGKLVSVPITEAIREILWPLQGHHPELVFTYVAKRTLAAKGKSPATVKGRRYPVTYSGAKSAWKRIRKVAKVQGFRFHDFRHDLATKLLRETGNLKLVQRALNHSDIKVTTKYAHVLDDEVAQALDRIAENRGTKRRKIA